MKGGAELSTLTRHDIWRTSSQLTSGQGLHLTISPDDPFLVWRLLRDLGTYCVTDYDNRAKIVALCGEQHLQADHSFDIWPPFGGFDKHWLAGLFGRRIENMTIIGPLSEIDELVSS